MPAPTTDFGVRDCGTLFIVTPHTVEAQLWVEENVQVEETWGAGFACEPRYVHDLLDGVAAEGFSWERN